MCVHIMEVSTYIHSYPLKNLLDLMMIKNTWRKLVDRPLNGTVRNSSRRVSLLLWCIIIVMFCSNQRLYLSLKPHTFTYNEKKSTQASSNIKTMARMDGRMASTVPSHRCRNVLFFFPLFILVGYVIPFLYQYCEGNRMHDGLVSLKKYS